MPDIDGGELLGREQEMADRYADELCICQWGDWEDPTVLVIHSECAEHGHLLDEEPEH